MTVKNKVEWLDTLCKRYNFTAEQLSKKSGVNILIIERILHKRWTPRKIERNKIAAVFGLRSEQIIFGHTNLVESIKDSS